MEWRPIDTAPKDGAIILVASATNGTFLEVQTCRWDGDCWDYLCGGTWEPLETDIKYWLSMPAVPEGDTDA